MIIPFPFAEIEKVAPHIRTLPNFAWKPVVVQVSTQVIDASDTELLSLTGRGATFWQHHLR